MSAPRRLPGLDADRLRALGLSRRELAVLELVAGGHTNAQVAEKLGISPHTVKKHLERMYDATGARNRAALIALLSDTPGRDGSAARGPAPRTHNLPAPLTSFVGREREIAELTSLLARARLITLGGPGGIGKTRLALEVASRSLGRWPDGVWLVELGDLSDPRLVLQTICAGVGVRESGRSRLAALIDELRSKELLLVLDNCEHLAQECAAIVGPLLRGCPEAGVLATSREALGVPGEAFWQVPALSVPDLVTASGPVLRSMAERSEAVRLFVDRASLRQPGFALTPENARPIAHVCRSLDGMPLAIELAAARLNVLSVGEVAARLDDRFSELRTSSADTVPRHRTLRGVVDWSYQLLARAEARLFERLSAFSGGWTLEAAQTVCAGGEVDPADVLDLLSRLVDKSFVIADPRRGVTRYRSLETLRRYGRERLERSGEAEAVSARHATYLCALAEDAEPKLKGPEQLAWYERLEAEHDNLRAALRWSLEHDPETALRLAGALWRFWDVRTYKEEGRRWLEAALAGSDGASPAVLVKALNGAGNMAQATGDYRRSLELHERSLALARELGDVPSVARSLSNLGDQAMNLGEHARARVLHGEALVIFEQLGDAWGVGISCNELGQIAYDLGDLETAGAYFARGLVMLRRSGDRHRTAHSLLHVGKVAREQGELEAAARSLAEALRTIAEFADTWMTTIAVGQIAAIATARGDAQEAVQLFAAAAATRRNLAMVQAPYWGRDLERWAAVAQSALGDRPFARAWSAGEAMPLDDAVARALRVADAQTGGAAGN